jgi:hypothetical protein
MCRRKLSSLVAALVCAALASAQEKYPALGIAIDAPPKYEPVPVQPSEPWIVLRFVSQKTSSELLVVRLKYEPDPEPLPKPPPLTNLERYLAQRMEDWKVTRTTVGKERELWACTEYELSPRKKQDFAGWAYELHGDDHVWILLGVCIAQLADKEIPAWRRCAEKLELFEPTAAPDADKWTKFYARNPAFRSPELRIKLRSKLVGDWEAEDTPNYLVVYHTKKESLVNHFEKRLEGIRRNYVERFPPAGEVTAVSTVRICENEEEYRLYGGPDRTAGYWNPRSEELVLYVFDNTGSDWKSGKEDGRIVLFHEAFHQYIHYAAGELAPHSWFNEGYGDYFSGAEFNEHGEVGRILVNPWRSSTIRQALERHEHPSWSEMVDMAKADYYGPNAGLNYAMGWSMIYFLETAAAVKKNPKWKAILPTYFETLKSTHARERARLESAGLTKNEEEVEKAAQLVRDAATAAAFEGVDMTEIQEVWREFMLELKGRR